MKIVGYRKDNFRGIRWDAPSWLTAALEGGMAFAYCVIDEERVIAWIACYTEDKRLEIISLGQEKSLENTWLLERLLLKIENFCREQLIEIAEVELIDKDNDKLVSALERSDFICLEKEKLWRVGKSAGNETDSSYVFKSVKELSQSEKKSLVGLFQLKEAAIPEIRGNMEPELMVAAVKDGQTEACVIACSYRGVILVEQLVYKNPEAGKQIWQFFSRKRNDGAIQERPCYVAEQNYITEIMGTVQETAREIYTWMAGDEEQLTYMETEAEIEVLTKDQNPLEAVCLSRLYRVLDVLSEEEVECHLAVDGNMQPMLLTVLKDQSGDCLMEIKALADDIDAGYFRYETVSRFLAHEGSDLTALVQEVNEKITEGTVFSSGENRLVLRSYLPEIAITDRQTFRWFQKNWLRSCRIIFEKVDF